MSRLESVIASWVGTPYKTNQRCKGVAVDCLHFVTAVWDELLDMDPSEERHNFQCRSEFLKTLSRLRRRYRPRPVSAALPGNVVVFDQAMAYHVGILLTPEDMVHASSSLGKVLTSKLSLFPDPVIIYEHPDRLQWLLPTPS